jgi:hypothetical protein
MEVTLRLGFKYLWVDRYCIPQNRPSKKQALINHMGAIYEHSAITIIAVAGSSPTHGLPGVDGTPRTGQLRLKVGQHSLVVGSMDGGKEIMHSEWNHRGWTFQESLLSSRQLIFTDSQVYFQCPDMCCCESLSIPLMDLRKGQRRPKRIPTILPILPRVEHGNIRTQNVEWRLGEWMSDFSRRELSQNNDALNAFSSILMTAKRLGWIYGHICGIPIFSTGKDLYKNTMMSSLLWCISTGENYSRRRSLPSWTWLGWTLSSGSERIYLNILLRDQSYGPGKESVGFAPKVSFEFLGLDAVSWEADVQKIFERSEANLIPTCLAMSGCWVFDFALPANPRKLREEGGGILQQGIRGTWTQGPYTFKMLETYRIINISRQMGLPISESDDSYQYTYLCMNRRELSSDGPDWSCRLLGFVLTRCHGRDTFERVIAGYVDLTCKPESPEPFHSNEPDPVLGWRKENIRLV